MMPVTRAHNNLDREANGPLVSLSDLPAREFSCSPVSRLLPEILTIIFTHGARDYHRKINASSGHKYRIPGWVDVSYVCRRWRNIALDSPTLWTYHFTVSLRWTDELLARSKQAPLRIRVYENNRRSNDWWSELLEKLLVHVERIEELRLRVFVRALPTTLSLRAPRLRILDIETYLFRHPNQTFTITDGDVSPLRTLRLVDCWLPWHSFNLSGVTRLFLCEVPAPGHNFVEFLEAVPRMQALVVLHLDYALAGARGFLTSGAFDVSPQIGLPCLAQASIAAPLSTVVALLSCVNIPLRTQVRLEFQWEDGSSIHDYTQLSLVLKRRFNQSKDQSSVYPSIRSLGIRVPYDTSTFTLCLSEQDSCNTFVLWEEPEWDCLLAICVEMWPSVRRSDLDHVLSNICCSFPLVDVQALLVDDPPFSSDFWGEILGHLPGLRRIELSDGLLPDLASLLALPADDVVETVGRGPARRQMFVPALEELWLYGIGFGPGDDLPRETAPKKSLCAAIASRNAPRPRLGIYGCYVKDAGSGFREEENTTLFFV